LFLSMLNNRHDFSSKLNFFEIQNCLHMLLVTSEKMQDLEEKREGRRGL
jgi:hypothetical protein